MGFGWQGHTISSSIPQTKHHLYNQTGSWLETVLHTSEENKKKFLHHLKEVTLTHEQNSYPTLGPDLVNQFCTWTDRLYNKMSIVMQLLRGTPKKEKKKEE